MAILKLRQLLPAISGWGQVMRIVVLVASLLSFVFLTAARGEERMALVVANSFLADAPVLATVRNSTKLIADTLTRGGFEVTVVTEASGAAFVAALQNFVIELSSRPAAVGLFYYAGYAVQADGRNYLLPVNVTPTTPGDLASQAIALDTVLLALGNIAPATIIVLDTRWARGTEPGLAPIDAPAGTMIVLSSQPGTVAADGNGATSTFAEAFAGALSEPGLDVDRVIGKTRDRIVEMTAGQQVPWVSDSLTSDSLVLHEDATELVASPPSPPSAISGADESRIYYPSEPGDGGSGSTAFDCLTGCGPDPSFDLTPDAAGQVSGAAIDQNAAINGAEIQRYEEEMARRLREEEQARLLYEEAARAEQALLEQTRVQESPPAKAERIAAEQQAITTLARHPTLDAPDSVLVSQVFTVSVALSEEKLTPEVTARAAPTTSLTPEGAIEMSLPAESDAWPIDIDLLAPGFDLADGGKWGRRVTLYSAGDSDSVRFDLKARAVSDVSKPRQLMARFYHAGRFLGSASRPVTVFREAQADEAVDQPVAGLMSVAASPPMTMQSNLLIGEEIEVPDLDLTVHYDDPDNLGSGLIFLHSPHISAPVVAEFTTPAGMPEWLNSQYLRLVQLGLRLRGAEPAFETAASRGAKPLAAPKTSDQASQKEFIAKVAEGFGDDLYRNYVPQPFKEVFWSLRRRGLLHSIQITSNSPVLPWELVRPQVPESALSDGFLGISYRLARWAPRSTASQVDQPLNRMTFTGVATVAPAYENNMGLPFQQIEIDALSKLAGFRMVGGDFSAFQKMVGEVTTGFIHFSGHGEVNDLGTGSPVFAIRLADQSLDPLTWRALTFAPRDKGNPFYFFNACDTGRAESFGGFVQGWGPAILASGASGFIGGMWPLSDRTAASFSTEFYGGLTGDLAEGPVYLAEVLQAVRRRFYETGDPTYLAYTFYGNANLLVGAR